MSHRKVLYNLDYKDLMHPADRSTIEWLNGLQVPYRTELQFLKYIATHPFDHSIKEWYELFKAGSDFYTFQDFLRSTTSKYREAYSEVENQGEGINITSESLPEMHDQLVRACRVLNVSKIPNYSTDWYYGIHQFSNGEKNHRLVMMSGSADLLTDAEMQFCLGHEIAHHEAGHKPYHMLVECFYLPFIDDGAFSIWASIVKLPLLEWYRTSDYTADRVGLLCCQSLDAALSFMIKKAGLPRKCYNEIDIESFKEQARHFEDHYIETTDKIIKTLSVRATYFPWLVDRASKLIQWYESGEYQRIIDNN